MADDLYALLGLPADTSLDRVRYAYEQAMAASTLRGDWSRAAVLSTAFDRLPNSRRDALYAGRGEPRSSYASAGPAITRRSARVALYAEPRPDRLRRRVWWSTAVVVVLVLGLVFWGTSRQPRSDVKPVQMTPFGSALATASAVGVAPASIAPTVAPAATPGRVFAVPANAPTGRDGLVTVACRAPGQFAVVIERVVPGALVSCPSGGRPRIVRTLPR